MLQHQTGDLSGAASSLPTDASLIVALINIVVGLTLQQWCLLIGAVCGVGTFLINWFYQRRQHRLQMLIAQKEHGIDINNL